LGRGFYRIARHCFRPILLAAATNKLDDDSGDFDYHSYTQVPAAAIGGGLDINLGKRFALRPAIRLPV
jgi:hypothetical protein